MASGIIMRLRLLFKMVHKELKLNRNEINQGWAIVRAYNQTNLVLFCLVRILLSFFSNHSSLHGLLSLPLSPPLIITDFL